MTVIEGPQPIVFVRDTSQSITVTIQDQWLKFQSPLVLKTEVTGEVVGGEGWPFGENPNTVDNIAKGIPTVLEQVEMPEGYRLLKWLLIVTDDQNELGACCEINAFFVGGKVQFSQFAIMGDDGSIFYDVEVVFNSGNAELLLTSWYDGLLSAKMMKLGVFD